MKIRAVQLDLARQPETLVYVRDFIAFAADFGFNSIVLYLEGRVKTASFPYMPDNQSYTPNDMVKVVKWAEQKNMDVIPVISNLGHTEHFLRYPQLAHLSELRGDQPGRFSTAHQCPHVVCPSLDETYRFFEAYMGEVASLFPSPYFHAGNDEAWDIGFCRLCKKRIQNGETQSDIFAEHLRRTHSFITGRLGKRMMIWDDLFEFYPEALTRIPKDIIMCAWHYDPLVDKPKTHFGNCRRFNSAATYRKLGFDFLICPWDWHPRNISSLTTYAEPYHPLGALLTTWEKGENFLLENFPNVAFAGQWWKRPRRLEPEDTYRKVCGKIFGVRDRTFLDALLAVKHQGVRYAIRQFQEILRGPVSPYENERSKLSLLLEHLLHPWLQRIKPARGRLILEDILARLMEENIGHGLRAMIDTLYARPDSAGILSDLKKRSAGIIREIRKYKKIRGKQWQAIRPGITPVKTDDGCDALEDTVRCLDKRITQYRGLGPRLTVRYFLPDQYGVQNVRISLRFKSGGWKEVYCGVPKSNMSDYSQTPYYTMTYLMNQKQPPREARVETWGYGGIGMAFLEVHSGGGRYIPSRVIRTSGIIRDARNILVEDTRWTFIGEQDSTKAFFATKLAGKRHILEIRLALEMD